MAIIKCIECGKDISSFAPSCPHCGCPAEYQGKKPTEQDVPVISEETISRPLLKNQDEWEAILELVLQNRVHDALVKAQRLVGKGPIGLIVARMASEKGVPVDLILQRFPDQAADALSKRPELPTKPCSVCGRVISSRAESCPHCGNPTGVHVCPSCGSTNTSVITGEEKGLSMFLFRGYSTNTVMSKFKCKDCGHKW